MREALDVLNRHYPLRFESAEAVRESVSTAYIARAGGQKYFLRAVKPAFIEGAARGAEIQLFLQGQGFPVPEIILAQSGEACVRDSGRLYILYAYIEGAEADPERDAEALGALVGKLHRAMRGYPGPLAQLDRQDFIGSYVGLLRAKQYPKADAFAAYGEALWDKVKGLPRGYCHGDMYRGNFLKTPGGALYVLDFDTSGEGFPMYDPALACNRTDYFRFRKNGRRRSAQALARFLPGYLEYSALTQAETDAFYDLIAIYHFALQARILELHGPDCVDTEFLDRQLDWLCRWREQCDKINR